MLEIRVASRMAITTGQCAASVVKMEPVRFCAIIQPRMACAARKVQRGGCSVMPRILKMMPTIIDPSSRGPGRWINRKSRERSNDSTNNAAHCKTGIPCS
ncbi:hypothetical protein D3C81_1416570 [compost metagenome]